MSSSILRPWQTRIWAPGQVKPNGVPRINWKHPLAWGLVSYWFDTGNGFYIDLVTGQVTTATSAGGTTVAPRTATPFGQGFSFTSTLTEQADPAVGRNQAWTAPYSCACGILPKGATSSGGASFFGLQDGSGNDAFNFFAASQALTVGLSVANGASPYAFTTVANTFYVLVGAATGATAQSHWVNGIAQTAGTVTSAFTGSGMHYAFNSQNSAYNSSAAPMDCNANVFFGAAWLGRALTQAEAILLYNDPYCFLIPATPEFQNVAAVVAAPVYDNVLPPVRARATPDLLTSFQGGFVGAPIAPQPQWNYDPSLPPLGRGPSIDLRTSYQSGSHGAVAGAPQADLPPLGRGQAIDVRTWLQPGAQGAVAGSPQADLPPLGRGQAIDVRTWLQPGAQGAKAGSPQAELPPLGRGQAIDVRTWFQSGSHGAVAGSPQADLPPLGRGRAIDVSTWLQPGAHGAVAQTQNDDALPPVRARSSPELLTWTVAAQVTAVVVQPPAYDSSLPPLGRGASVDLRTSYQAGSQGARAQTQNDDALPSLGRGPPFDIRTWIVPGRAGAVAQRQNDDALPPRGRGAAIELTWVVGGLTVVQVAQVPAYDTSLPPRVRAGIDLITWIQPGSHGAPAQTQNDDALPPRGRGPAVDLTWNVAGQVTVALVQPIPAYDTSLPPSRLGLPIDLGTSYQAGSHGAKAQTQNDDARPPLGRGSSVDIITWLIAGSHGAVAQTQNDTELPPRGRGAAVELSWTVSGQVTVQFAQIPFYDTSLPPRGRGAGIELQTWFQAGYVSYGATAQTQNDDSLPPRGRGAAIELTFFESLNPGGPPGPPPGPPQGPQFDLGVRHRRYTVSQWTQVSEWLKARRAKRKEEEEKAAAAKVAEIAIAAIDEVETPPVKAPRKPLPLSTKARRKLREALARPLPPQPIIALAVTTTEVLAVPGPSFAERRAQLRAEWEAVLAEHERAIEEEDEEAVVHVFMHLIGGEDNG